MPDELLEGVLAGVRQHKRKHGNTGLFRRDMRPLQVSCTREFAGFIARAAKAMGVNRSAFARRALAVAASQVLNVDVRQILYYTPKVRPFEYDTASHFGDAGERDDGSGIEQWCPHPGCDGQHLVR